MAKEIIDLRQKLEALKYKNKLWQQIDCSEEENKEYCNLIKDNKPLPDGVYQYESETRGKLDCFCTIYKTDLTDAEKIEYFTLKQSANIKTIKDCVVFFTVLAMISLVVLFIYISGS